MKIMRVLRLLDSFFSCTVMNGKVFSTRGTLARNTVANKQEFTSEANFLYLQTSELSASHFSTRRGKRQ